MTINNKKMSLVRRIFNFYYEGFHSMTVGRTLWLIIFIKLFIMFAIFRLFFFHDFLGSRFNSENEKSNYVIEQLTKPK
jgi:hypothetical protein